MDEIKGFRCTQIDLDFDGTAEIRTINSYKKMEHGFAVENRMKGITENFSAGDYIVCNGIVIWGVTEEDFDRKYRILNSNKKLVETKVRLKFCIEGEEPKYHSRIFDNRTAAVYYGSAYSNCWCKYNKGIAIVEILTVEDGDARTEENE